ncbi:MAG: glycosyltransferase family 9 protein [Alphaproteobacteria bacterium]
MTPRILIIKLSALGDFVQAMTAMQAVRAHYPNGQIDLLTTKPFLALAKACGLFDEIIIDPRPKITERQKLKQLKLSLNSKYTQIIDFQTNDRTRMYSSLLVDPKPDWVGPLNGARFEHKTPWRHTLPALERMREQLQIAGIPYHPFDDLKWAQADLSKFELPDRYALLVPGGSAHRPEKRWPAPRYGMVAAHLADKGITPIVLGHGEEEAALAATIIERAPTARSLVSQTDFLEIISLARPAYCAIGNDTGPMHLIAPTGCPSLVLFSNASTPALCRPRGADVVIFQRDDLASLPHDEVTGALP